MLTSTDGHMNETMDRGIPFERNGLQDSHGLHVPSPELDDGTQLANGWRVLVSEQPNPRATIVGDSAKILEAIELSRRAARTKSTVLLLGESGTGKENFARAIHDWSDRKSKRFVAINCVGLSKELLESELFGHEKGAFTGAHQTKKGRLELADGGTVFLDEIGDIAPEIQTKLLRFLENREFERVGGTQTIKVDVRIVAATNRDLERAVQDGSFRLDLFFRLNVIPIGLPPLRERKDDISALAKHFVRRFGGGSNGCSVELEEAALRKLEAHDWPGNVRELANVIERAMVFRHGPEIVAEDLVIKASSLEPTQELENLPYHEAVHAFRQKIIRRALEQTGSQVAAAKMLRLQKTYLSRLIKDLQVRA